MAGRAQMKTGTLKGVTALAGYVLDRDGRRWVVVSLMNNPRLPTWAGKAAEDALVGWVYREAGTVDTRTQGPRQAQALAPSWFLQPTSAPQ
jgi:serine-type D-Ala-D-Ala carboxypeptidase/endopeptidase (penicillin-binding protein 4)